uniref:Uncharacterized protein n=1 Tax=Proboscia inermis TaxID=420281 RepID=A0A6T8JP30_9STRA|mmetsp:Transcript_3067/g.3096  ORF Transcript_3067/g.3096 Transcript_3067/m.3096 type:complete len:134 (+) Transcript_3067:219-620(+)
MQKLKLRVLNTLPRNCISEHYSLNLELQASSKFHQIDVTLAKADENDSGDEISDTLPQDKKEMILVSDSVTKSSSSLDETKLDMKKPNQFERIQEDRDDYQPQMIEMNISLGKIDDETMALMGPPEDEDNNDD